MTPHLDPHARRALAALGALGATTLITATTATDAQAARPARTPLAPSFTFASARRAPTLIEALEARFERANPLAARAREERQDRRQSVGRYERRIDKMIAAGNRIARLPYLWGGGHGSFTSSGYDCSGSVSYVLHAAGLLLDTGGLEPTDELRHPGPRQAHHDLRQRRTRLDDDRRPPFRHDRAPGDRHPLVPLDPIDRRLRRRPSRRHLERSALGCAGFAELVDPASQALRLGPRDRDPDQLRARAEDQPARCTRSEAARQSTPP